MQLDRLRCSRSASLSSNSSWRLVNEMPILYTVDSVMPPVYPVAFCQESKVGVFFRNVRCRTLADSIVDGFCTFGSDSESSKVQAEAGFLTDDFQLPIYNVWKWKETDSKTKHFGNSNEAIVERLLYLYTKPFDDLAPLAQCSKCSCPSTVYFPGPQA